MQAVNANGVPVLITVHPLVPAQDTRLFYLDMRKDLAKQLIILGSLQAAFGALSIILEAVSVIVSAQGAIFSLAFHGHGFWFGILVSGLLYDFSTLNSIKGAFILRVSIASQPIVIVYLVFSPVQI